MDDMDDHVDLSELEANLYAQIHHDAPETVEQYTAAQKLHQRATGTISAVSHSFAGQPPPTAFTNRIVTSSSVHNTGGGGAPPKRGRYWSDAKSGAGGNVSLPFANAGGPGAGNQAPKKRINPFAAMPTVAPAMDVTPVSLVSAQATANDYRPKPFTPYTSYLSQIGTSYVPLELPPSTTTTHCAPSAPMPVSPNATATIQQHTMPTTTTIINPAATRKQRNKQRRKGGEHTAGQLRQLDRARHAQEQFQRVGAVQRLAEGKLKKTQQLRAKQERAGDARQAANAVFTSKSKVASSLAKPSHPFVTIDLVSDTADDDDDDDVICIPVPPPPLVCIESSDDEQEPASADTSTESARTPAADDDADSITEDFVGRRDRNRLSLCVDDSDAAMALGGIADSDLDMICATVEDAIRQHEQPASEAAPAVRSTEVVPNMDSDNTVFVTPKRSRNATATTLALDDNCSAVNQSYEVAENGFAAVDIYESESSDFPESVYEKGSRTPAIEAADANGTAAANASDSDVSSIQLNTSNRAKRRCKRRSSTGKGSDYKSSDNNEDDNVNDDDSDSDDDDANDSNDGPAFVDILRATNTPYLQRGEAVANAKSKITRVPAVPPRRRRSLGKAGRTAVTSTPTRGDAQSDDDFVSMLSCIVHDDKTGGGDGAGASADDSAELEAERPTIDARAIVENVLSKAAAKKESRRAKKAGGVQPAASVWMITDEVGQSDDAVAPAEPGHAKKSASSEKRSGVAGSVAGKSTAADFFVLDSVGETDPIPAPVVVVVATGADNADDTQVAVGASSSTTAKAARAAPTATATAAPNVAAAGEGSDDDNASVRSCSLVVDNPELAWNDEMRSFYNKSWGGENYNQAEILRQMPSKLCRSADRWTGSQVGLSGGVM